MSRERAGDYERWLAFVRRFAEAYEAGREGTLPRTEPAPVSPRPDGSGPRVVICAPHPDDEMLSGALALRLQREAGCGVLVLALTLGSDPARKEERKEELAASCRVAGFGWRLATEPLALATLRPELERDAGQWERLVLTIAGHFQREAPALVLLPHAGDGHPAHVAAHRLVVQSLVRHTRDAASEVLLAETEYWRPLSEPNLLVGVAPEELALLVAALVRHRGEVARHPYHLRQPARMMDSVRRGSELLAGFGQPAAELVFGELYRLGKMRAGELELPKWPAVLPPGAGIDPARLAGLFRGGAQAE
jgi:N-acetylglucosamine malate deacetylase 1